MAKKLTEKQEIFTNEWHRGCSKSEAYRRAYKTENMDDATIWNNAYVLSKDSDVLTRLEELKAESRERCQINVEIMTMQLNNDHELAHDTKQASAAVAASMATAKLHGLIVDKQEVKSDIAARLSRARETLPDAD